MTRNFRYLKIDEPEMLLPQGAPTTAGTVGPIADPLPDTFSDAIDQMGMGLFQRRLIVMGGMGWLIDAIEVLVVAFIMDDVAATFSLSTFSKGLVGSASFFGMLFGVIFWSVYADKHGRRWAFVLTQACIFVAGLASSLAPSYSLLLLSRVAVGFGVGGSLPVTSALVAEFLPTKDRAKILCYISGAFWGFGLICASLLGLLLYRIFGSGQENMWRWYLGLSAAPAALVCLAYRLIPESARYLSVVGRNDEALRVLEEVARVNGKLYVLGLDSAGHGGEDVEARLTSVPASDISTGGGYKKIDVRSERGVAAAVATRSMDSYTSGESREQDRDTLVQSGERDSKRLLATRPEFFGRADEAGVAKAGDVRDLFRTPMYRRVTICVWMFWLFVNISYFGYAFVLPKYYQKIAGGDGDLVYMFTALSGTSLITGSFVSIWMCDENRLGRVGTLMWSSLATALCMLLQAMCCDFAVLFVPLSVVTMLAIAVSCSRTRRAKDLDRGYLVPSIVKYVITPELYSTKYRVVALGSASVWTRIGGMIAPIMAEVLFDRSPILPLAAFCPAMVLCGIFAGFIPVETAGRKLDDDSWDCNSFTPATIKSTPPPLSMESSGHDLGVNVEPLQEAEAEAFDVFTES